MKVLYIHQYFKTPEEGGAIRSYYLAKGMVDHGIEVELITSHNKKKAEIRNIDGIKVHYLPVYYDATLGFFGRVYSFFKFMRMVRRYAHNIKNIDVCYATSTPLTIGVSAMNIKRDLKVPYLFEVRDLWPDAPVQMGVIKNKWLKKYLKYLEAKVYKNANKIVALSPGIRDEIVQTNNNIEVALIPNMADVDFFQKENKLPELENTFGVKNKFVVSYFGAIGKANHLEYLLAAANACLKKQLPVKFLIIGVGAELEKLKYLVRHFDLSNVEFISFQNKFNLHRVLNITDAAYVSFANKPILETNSPNKFFDALASGKLIITNTKGWVKDICEKNVCGFYADPERPDSFASSIKKFIDDPEILETFQTNARAVGESEFSKNAQVEKLIKALTLEG